MAKDKVEKKVEKVEEKVEEVKVVKQVVPKILKYGKEVKPKFTKEPESPKFKR